MITINKKDKYIPRLLILPHTSNTQLLLLFLLCALNTRAYIQYRYYFYYAPLTHAPIHNIDIIIII
jgi:hypothetical protein